MVKKNLYMVIFFLNAALLACNKNTSHVKNASLDSTESNNPLDYDQNLKLPKDDPGADDNPFQIAADMLGTTIEEFLDFGYYDVREKSNDKTKNHEPFNLAVTLNLDQYDQTNQEKCSKEEISDILQTARNQLMSSCTPCTNDSKMCQKSSIPIDLSYTAINPTISYDLTNDGSNNKNSTDNIIQNGVSKDNQNQTLVNTSDNKSSFKGILKFTLQANFISGTSTITECINPLMDPLGKSSWDELVATYASISRPACQAVFANRFGNRPSFTAAAGKVNMTIEEAKKQANNSGLPLPNPPVTPPPTSK